MALRDFNTVRYLPFLSLRPAEMRALEELPDSTKDEILPVVHLRPWGVSNDLDKSLERIKEAYGERPIVVSLADPEPMSVERPVHRQLRSLRDHSAAYQNWCDFIRNQANLIPALQLGDPDNLQQQIDALCEIKRGLVIIIERPLFSAINEIVKRVSQRTNGGADVCFVLDYGRASADHLQVAAAASQFVRNIKANAPYAKVSISASSFPDGFKGLTEQPIYERRLFSEVRGQIGPDVLIYSDRGSARVERQQGGGGTPVPRIDYPLDQDWRFFRSDEGAGFDGYRAQARLLMLQNIWQPALRVWGTLMIERTSAGDRSAISNPNRATAARINLHLQKQTFYDAPDEAFDTEDDWDD